MLDYLVASAPDHRAFRQAIDEAQTRYIPGLILAEVDYFLRRQRPAMYAFMRDVRRGAFTYAPPTLPLLLRAMEIDQRFKGLGLGLVDASIAALAETLGIVRLATRDIRHFSSIRLRDGKMFEFVVQPTRPDRGE